MKRLIAILLIAVLTLGLCVTAYADDGTQNTQLTITIPTGTYNVWIPMNMTCDVITVLNATEEQKADLTGASITSGADNYIGYVGIVWKSASNCRFVSCKIGCHDMTKGTAKLPYSLYINYPKKDAGFAARAAQTLSMGSAMTFLPFCSGRYTLPRYNSVNKGYNSSNHPICNEGEMDEYGYADLWLRINGDDIKDLDSGSYVGKLSFVFESFNVKPTTGIF